MLKAAEYFTKQSARRLVRLGISAEFNLKDYKLAQSYYLRSATLDPNEPGPQYRLATLYNQQYNCELVGYIHGYLRACSLPANDDNGWCSTQYSGSAYASVGHLQKSKPCPQIDDYNFNGL